MLAFNKLHDLGSPENCEGHQEVYLVVAAGAVDHAKMFRVDLQTRLSGRIRQPVKNNTLKGLRCDINRRPRILGCFRIAVVRVHVPPRPKSPNGFELSGAANLHRTSNRALAASAPASG